jgi:hypothetical protein
MSSPAMMRSWLWLLKIVAAKRYERGAKKVRQGAASGEARRSWPLEPWRDRDSLEAVLWIVRG